MFIKREKKDDCLISGYVVCDQKIKEYNGKQFVEFGISMGKDENDENLPIVNVAIWERNIPEIKKGDRVLATGKLKVTTKDDKIYYSLTADFCIKEILCDGAQRTVKKVEEEAVSIDDDDLPF